MAHNAATMDISLSLFVLTEDSARGQNAVLQGSRPGASFLWVLEGKTKHWRVFAVFFEATTVGASPALSLSLYLSYRCGLITHAVSCHTYSFSSQMSANAIPVDIVDKDG